jgi:hypothetical protein
LVIVVLVAYLVGRARAKRQVFFQSMRLNRAKTVKKISKNVKYDLFQNFGAENRNSSPNLIYLSVFLCRFLTNLFKIGLNFH